MKCHFLPALALLAVQMFAADPEKAPLYANDFSGAEIGQTPKDFLIVAGVFTVQQEGAK